MANIEKQDIVEAGQWWYHSLTAHQHQKGHTVPKQVIMIATLIQVATVLSTALCESNSLRPSLNKKSDKPDTQGAPQGGCSHAPRPPSHTHSV